MAKSKPKPVAAPAPEVRAPAPELAPVGPPATSGPEIVVDVRLASVGPCPFNVRQHFDPADIASLADSIRAIGLKDPLLVRPVGNVGGSVPEWNGFAWVYLGEPAYQLADGERRFRALTLIHQVGGDIGKAPPTHEVPVIVRPMTDEQVRAVMLVSREQSRDLRMSELVAGYTALAVGRTVEQLAEFLGRKEEIAHVRGMLKLAKLPAWALAAIDAGKLKPASAVLLGGLHSEQSRKRAAACAILGFNHLDEEVDEFIADHFDRGEDPTESDTWDYEGPLTYRELKDLLAVDFQRELKSAPFSRQALDLLEGVGSCDACPKRAGNDPDAVAAKVRADMCLDPECYRAKEEAWNKKVVEAAKESGKTILPKKEAEKLFNRYGADSLAHNAGYVKLTTTCYDDKDRRTYGELLKDHVAADKVVIAVSPKTGTPFELVREELADKVLKEKYRIGVRSSSSGSNDRWLKEQRERRKKAEIGREASIVANGMVADKIRDILPPGFATFQGGIPLLQQIVATVADVAGADACRCVAKRRELEKDKRSDRQAVEELAFKLTDPRELVALIGELAATRRTWSWGSEYAGGHFSDGEKAFLKAFGVDRAKLVAEAAAAKKAAKSKKKQDKKAAKQQGKKPVAAEVQAPVPAEPESPTWRQTPLAETGWEGEWDEETWVAIATQVRTAGELADKLLAGEKFGLRLVQLEDAYSAIELISEDDEHPIRFGEDLPESQAEAPPTLTPVTQLIDVDNFPDVVADTLFPKGISTVETLMERMTAEVPDVDLPTTNKLVTFFVQQGVKINPAKHAAKAIADHGAKKAPAEPAAPWHEVGGTLPVPKPAVRKGKAG